MNVVSSRYGHISNQMFFGEATRMLQNAGMDFKIQSINRNDRSFAMDFIINDENQFIVKNEGDKILPMLSFLIHLISVSKKMVLKNII